MISFANDRVQIDLSLDDYNALLIALGYAAGASMRDQDFTLTKSFFRLVNRVNEGHPNFTPYEEGSEQGKR